MTRPSSLEVNFTLSSNGCRLQLVGVSIEGEGLPAEVVHGLASRVLGDREFTCAGVGPWPVPRVDACVEMK